MLSRDHNILWLPESNGYPTRVHFGLGSDKSVRLIEITWPSGIMQRMGKLSADQILTVREPMGESE